MANIRLDSPRVSALNTDVSGGSAGDTNSDCHKNTGGVEPNDKVILARVRVAVLCWGKFYEDHPDALDNAFALCRDLVTGPYLNGLAQYGIGRGSIAGSALFNFSPPPATLSPDEARKQLLAWLRDTGSLFAPSKNENSLLFVVFLPPETKPTIASGKNDFCGYHDWAKFHDDSKESDVFYCIIRTDSADRTSGAKFIRSVSYCVSHEIAEAVTSPDGRGYHKGNCEIGDLCEQTGTHRYRGWDVEQYWSQWDRKCINGEEPVSLRSFLKARGIAGGRLRDLRAGTINVEFIASQFR